MKYIAILIFISFQSITFGQSQTYIPTYSKIPQSINQQDSIILIADLVNLRNGPDMDSLVMANLSIDSPLQYLGRKHSIKQNGLNNHYWIHVATPLDSGYIHSSLTMFPKHMVQSSRDSTVYFLQSENKILIKKMDSIIYVHESKTDNPYEISSSYDSQSGLETIILTFVGEYCGGYNGTESLCWDGINIFSCGSTGFSGDGMYSEDYSSEIYIDPVSDYIYIYKYSFAFEGIDISGIIDISNSIDFLTHSSTNVTLYNGHSVKPVNDYPQLPIPDSPLKSLMQKEFNEHTLPKYYLKVDVNNDGRLDVLFIHKGVYFALADSSNTLSINAQNKALNNQIKSANIQKYNSGIALNIIKNDSEDGTQFRRIEFIFDKALNQLIVSRTIDAIINEDVYDNDENWSEIQQFKTNKLTLDKIW